MKFQDLLLRAKAGEQDAIHTILEMYKPLLLKESIVLGVFDEDLYQELCITVVHCIEMFKI
ncbi:MAG: helix-turn-helix domain-containing protein [Bacteroidaceae bacterium]|nr:helix-turn-helix domain-containing protein [Bacteroidaceae bacterium]